MRWLLIALLLLALPVMAENDSNNLRDNLHKINFEEALSKGILRGERIVEGVESEDLILRLNELKDLKNEIEEMNVDVFLSQKDDLKDRAKGIISEFRRIAQNLVKEKDREQFRGELKHEVLDKYKEKRKELRTELQVEMVKKKLESLNITDDKLLEIIKNDDLNVKELREKIREHFSERMKEKREERKSERESELKKGNETDENLIEDSEMMVSNSKERVEMEERMESMDERDKEMKKRFEKLREKKERVKEKRMHLRERLNDTSMNDDVLNETNISKNETDSKVLINETEGEK